MFQYKTRGNASPQGKQKVYFTCHPDDFSLYYEKISGQILDFADCAIWHWDSGDGYPDVQVDLQGMRLFVIPVTSKLLLTQNRTIDIDLPFALKNNIPVLPLMQEGGLDELFGRKFGSLHYLDENARDDTALPYKEKLKRYLASVIVGDELAEKVRKAFDAYIFLSYRKKDRKYAQELMRLIHENDFCRDIAIWYDEFLTPGENFNDAIVDALKKSELFALVVTPNLVNEENYVRRIEYPMARNAEKKILPAELVDTDRAKLAEMYEDIPDCVNPSDSSLLSEALLDALQSIAKRENDSDPRHNFFIGLAYLSGIDVETNPRRARELIGSAAEAGLPEALEKLASMYQNGDGVERDYHRAIEYQRKLVGVLREKYQESDKSSDGNALGIALYNLGNYLYDIGGFSEAEVAYKEMGEVFSGLSDHRMLALSYSRLGDIRKEQGSERWWDAEDFYQKSLELMEIFVGETQTVEARRDLALSYDRLGDIYRYIGDCEPEAYNCYHKSLKLRETLAGEVQTVETRRDLALSYEHMGNLIIEYFMIGDPEDAEDFAQKSIELREVIAEEAQTLEARRDLALSYKLFGDIRMEQALSRNLKEQDILGDAVGFYQKSIAVMEPLIKEAWTVEMCRTLAEIYKRLGDIRKGQEQIEKAEGFYQKAVEIMESLTKEAKVFVRYLLEQCYKSLGKICEVQGQLAEAVGFYWKYLELREVLVGENLSLEARRDLALNYGNLRYLSETDEYYCLKFLNLTAKSAGEIQTVEERRKLAVGFDRLGGIREASGRLGAGKVVYDNFDVEKAKEEVARQLVDADAGVCYQISVALREALARDVQTVEARRDLAVGYVRLGDISKAQGQFAEADDFYQKTLELMESLAEETQTVRAHCDLALAYVHLGDLRKTQRLLAKAEGFYQKAVERMEPFAKETQMVFVCFVLEQCYESLGDIRKAQEQLGEAGGFYQKAVELVEPFVRETQTVETRCGLSLRYDNLGHLYQGQGMFAEAENFYQKAVELVESLASHTTEACLYLVPAYYHLGNLRENQGQLAEAEGFYQKALEAIGALVRKDLKAAAEDNYDIGFLILIGYEHLGSIRQDQGQLAEAEVFYRKSLEVWEVLVRKACSR